MASTAIAATGTVLQIATGTGGAKTISGVAVGNPTVLTATAHGFSNGDVVAIAALSGADAAELNGSSFVVQFKTTNTFAVAKDTTGKTITAGSGTATPTTYTAIGNVKSFSQDSTKAKLVDVTNFASTYTEVLPTILEGGGLSAEFDFDDANAGQTAARSALSNKLKKDFKLILPAGSTPNGAFSAYVTEFSINGKPDDAVRASLKLQFTGTGITWS